MENSKQEKPPKTPSPPSGSVKTGKLFLGGLSQDTVAADLQSYFRQFGTVKESFIKMDALTGRSRGFGFVIFVDASATDRVLTSGPHNLKGKTLDIKTAVPKHLTKDRGLGSRKVFVGGLSQLVTEDYLEFFFAKFGPVMEVKIMFDHSTPPPHRHRGFAFVTFVDPSAADEVCRINYHQVMDKLVEVKLASIADEPSRGKIVPATFVKKSEVRTKPVPPPLVLPPPEEAAAETTQPTLQPPEARPASTHETASVASPCIHCPPFPYPSPSFPLHSPYIPYFPHPCAPMAPHMAQFPHCPQMPYSPMAFPTGAFFPPGTPVAAPVEATEVTPSDRASSSSSRFMENAGQSTAPGVFIYPSSAPYDSGPSGVYVYTPTAINDESGQPTAPSVFLFPPSAMDASGYSSSMSCCDSHDGSSCGAPSAATSPLSAGPHSPALPAFHGVECMTPTFPLASPFVSASFFPPPMFHHCEGRAMLAAPGQVGTEMFYPYPHPLQMISAQMSSDVASMEYSVSSVGGTSENSAQQVKSEPQASC